MKRLIVFTISHILLFVLPLIIIGVYIAGTHGVNIPYVPTNLITVIILLAVFLYNLKRFIKKKEIKPKSYATFWQKGLLIAAILLIIFSAIEFSLKIIQFYLFLKGRPSTPNFDLVGNVTGCVLSISIYCSCMGFIFGQIDPEDTSN